MMNTDGNINNNNTGNNAGRNNPGKITRKNIAYAAIAVIIIMGAIAGYNWPACNRVQFINASLTVKAPGGMGMLGLNTDTDSLRFGVVSAGIEAQRKFYLQQDGESEVEVTMLGQLAEWTTIEPPLFTLQEGEKKQVSVTVGVPLFAAEGDYLGKVKLCFNE